MTKENPIRNSYKFSDAEKRMMLAMNIYKIRYSEIAAKFGCPKDVVIRIVHDKNNLIDVATLFK